MLQSPINNSQNETNQYLNGDSYFNFVDNSN